MDSETSFLIKVAETAMEIEHTGILFYFSSADSAKEKAEKEVLTFLGTQEERHLAFFKKLHDMLVEGASIRDMPEYEGKRFDMPPRPKIFPTKAEMQGKGYSNVVEEGIKAEDRSISFYTSAATQLSKPVAKKVFETIIGEEKKHKELLEFQRDVLEQHGIWTGMEEHARLEG